MTRNPDNPTLICLIGSLLLTVNAAAHHSPSAFDTAREITVRGEIIEYSFRNPHVYMTLAIDSGEGAVKEMEIEAGAGSVIGPLGFARDAVAVGDVVTISGNPGRRNPDQLMLGLELYKSDGSYYPLNIRSRSIYEARDAVATSIEGTWFSESSEFFAFLQGANSWPLTQRGQDARAATDPMETTQKDCIPLGPPGLMLYPVANTITVESDRVIIKIDWLDSIRTVYMDGRGHPDAGDAFLLGHSIGEWDGNALVIDTTNFSDHPMGLAMNLPGGRGKHLTERLELNANGKGISYSGEITDAEYLLEPVRWSGQWIYRPDMQHSNEACDLDVARRFLSE
jgi:hypothetical protein